MYKIALVEDEDRAADRLQEVIAECCARLKVECQVTRFKNGMEFITDYKPVFDLVMLDIEMPLMDGMEAAKKLRQYDEDVFIIFITNLAQYAIKGYEVEALDFILKPVEFKSFFNKFKKFIKMVSEKKDKYVVINVEGASRKINVNDILYIEVIAHFLHYHLKEETIASYGVMKQTESKMEQFGFFRMYKSYLINLARIKEITLNTVIMDDGAELPISRFRKKEFLQKAAEYFGNGYFSGEGV